MCQEASVRQGDTALNLEPGRPKQNTTGSLLVRLLAHIHQFIQLLIEYKFMEAYNVLATENQQITKKKVIKIIKILLNYKSSEPSYYL